ncbi:hypothetical protein MAM1_0088c04809 [Mucor ambiguus]|uniref:Uncharacterized protein n=1 Tax=Mucor ambiguus TaxID=91626 RepID=A0A0C9MDF7_9FUNG|nr:hypothetical protein MAM1_0088c04809 [Mucor ambiguus]
MEEEYDYSKYTVVHSMDICSVRKTLMIYRANNRTSQLNVRYIPEEYFTIPLDFYYNKSSGNIVYGRQMIYHYRQYPPHEKYVHVPNFVEDLYKLYQRSRKGESATQDDTALCSAIASFLTKVYPFRRFKQENAFKTQHAFILPSQKYTDKDFINTTLRPLLQNTPWLTPVDSTSKTVFYSKIDTFTYYLNRLKLPGLRLEREKKYLYCSLQKTRDHRHLMLTVRFIRAVYDPDLIAASGKSMTALGGDMILSSKMISPALLLEIPINPTLAKMAKLAELLYNEIFAGEEWEERPTLLEKYNTDSSYKSPIHRLIYSILMSKTKDVWSREIDTDDLYNGEGNWSNMFCREEKLRLSCITYGDIMQLFDDVDVSSIKSEIKRYLEKYGDEEMFQSIVLIEEEKNMRSDLIDINPYKVHNLAFAEKYGQRFYLLRVKKAIVHFLEQLKKSKSTGVVSLRPWNLTEGCAYKIGNMVQLSNRIGRPVVIKPVGEIKQESSKEPSIQKEKLALIDKIQPYGYYVETNISCSNEIKMSLNQVIETTVDNKKLQRSTMSILDSSYQTSDMYDFIFDAIWSNINGHCADLQCRLSQKDESVDFDSYNTIRADMIDTIKKSMENKSNITQDLDKAIYHYNAKLNCTCDIIISHRLVVDIGLLPYLRSIASEIVASLKASAIFGNHKILCLLVTGDFLYKWLEQENSAYGELIWNQLQEAIISELNNKQLRVYLMMKKSMVLEDYTLNYKPFKLEMYRQVFSRRYYLKILAAPFMKNPRLYQDKGDRCILIPFMFTDLDDALIWEISLLPDECKGDSKCLLESKFYVINNPEDTHRVYWEASLVALSATENTDTSTMNVALISELDSYLSSVKTSKARSTFPIVVKIMPCSYLSAISLRLRLGIDASADDPLRYDHVAYSERLTLQKI